MVFRRRRVSLRDVVTSAYAKQGRESSRFGNCKKGLTAYGDVVYNLHVEVDGGQAGHRGESMLFVTGQIGYPL